MESILFFIILLILCIGVYVNIFYFRHLNGRLKILTEFQDGIFKMLTEQQTHNEIDFKQTFICIDRLDRSLLDLREALNSAKPIKPNNWDSVKEAFKGPSKVDPNVRN